jgi:hypothetical protein
VSDKTLRNLEAPEALNLEPGTLDNIRDGGTPVERPDDGRPPTVADDEIVAAIYVTRAGELLHGIAGNTPEEREQVLALLRRGRDRLSQNRHNNH